MALALMLLSQMNPAINRHLELGIKTLQNAARDLDKLQQHLKRKEREEEEVRHRLKTHKG
jgi:hypothetical protein